MAVYRSRRSNPLAGLLRLLVVLAVAYFAITEGWPWLRDELGLRPNHGTASSQAAAGDSGDTAEAERCVQRAAAASSALSGALRSFRTPPYDQAAWGAASLDLADSLGAAESACLCGAPACGKAGEAVAVLRDLFSRVDAVVRGTSADVANTGRMRARADDLLAEARRLAAGGG